MPDSSNHGVPEDVARMWILGDDNFPPGDPSPENSYFEARKDLYLQPEPGSVDWMKRLTMQESERRQLAWEAKQAVARGILTPQEADSAFNLDRRSAIQKWMGFAAEKSDGSVLQTFGDMLFSGLYGVASFSKARAEAELYDRGRTDESYGDLVGRAAELVSDEYLGPQTTDAIARGLGFEPHQNRDTSAGDLMIRSALWAPGITPEAYLHNWRDKTTFMDMYNEYQTFGEEGSWGNLVAGLISDLALDPTVLLTFGVGKGSQVVVRAGASEAAERVLVKSLTDEAAAYGATRVPGGSRLTLSRWGSRFFKAASADIETSLKAQYAGHANWRKLAGLPDAHLLDAKLSADWTTQITDHMLTNFERLRKGVTETHAQGRLGKGLFGLNWSKGTRWIPGSASFESRVVGSTTNALTAGLQAAGTTAFGKFVRADKAAELLRLQPEDLFYETANFWQRDLGIGNAFGTAKQGVLRELGVTGAITKLLAPLNFGAGVSEETMQLARAYRHRVDEASSAYRDTYTQVFKDLDPEEQVTLVHALEAEGMGMAHLPASAPGYVNQVVKDEAGNVITKLMPDGSSRARVVAIPASAGDVLSQGTLGTYQTLNPKLRAAAQFFNQQMDEILEADRAAGYPTHRVEGYVSHLYTDKRAQELVLNLVLKRNAPDAIRSANRFTQARNIATIHAAEELFGKGSVLTDPTQILYLRRMASIELHEKGKFLAELEAREGFAKRLAFELMEGVPKPLLNAAARRIGVGVSHVMQLDQVYKAEYSRLRTVGFQEGNLIHNRTLLEYLMQAPTKEGRFSEAWTKVAQDLGFREDAHLFLHNGAELPSKVTFSLKEKGRFVPGYGYTPGSGKGESLTMGVLDLLKVLDNPNHPMWRTLLTSDVAQMHPHLGGAEGLIRALDSYFVRHLDAPLEAFQPNVRQQVARAFDKVIQATGKTTIRGSDVAELKTQAAAIRQQFTPDAATMTQIKALREKLRVAKGNQIAKVRSEIARLQEAGGAAEQIAELNKQLNRPVSDEITHLTTQLRSLVPPHTPEQKVLIAEARTLSAQAALYKSSRGMKGVSDSQLKNFERFMDKLSANRELRRMVPQLPTPLVNYLKQQRQLYGIATEAGPPTELLIQELRLSMGRLKVDTEGLRQISRVYLDKELPSTYHDYQALIRLFDPPEVGRTLSEMVPVTLHVARPVKHGTTFAAEDARVLGSLDERGRYTEILKGAEAKVTTEAAKKAISEGRLPPEESIISMGGRQGDVPLDAGAEKISDAYMEQLKLRQAAEHYGQVGKQWAHAEREAADAKYKLRAAEHSLAVAKRDLKALMAKVPRSKSGRPLLDAENKAARISKLQVIKAAKENIERARTAVGQAERDLETYYSRFPQLKSSPRYLDIELKKARRAIEKVGEVVQLNGPKAGLKDVTSSPKVMTRTLQMYLPVATERMLRDMFAPNVDPAWGDLTRRMVFAIDHVHNLFKANWILPWLGSWGRDIIGTTSMVTLANGLSMFHPERGKKLFNVLSYILSEPSASEKLLGRAVDSAKRERLGNMVLNIGGRDFLLKDLVNEMHVHGVLRTHVSADVVPGFQKVGRFGAAMAGGFAGGTVGATVGAAGAQAGLGDHTDGLAFAGVLLGALSGGRVKGGNKILDPVTHLLQTNWTPLMRHREWATEIPFRVSTFLHGLEETGSLPGAADHLYKYLNDYNMLSAVERRYLKRAIPFYQWTKTAFKYNLNMLVEHPDRVGAILKTVKNWNTYMEADPEDVPDYFAETIWLAVQPYQQGGYNVLSGLGLPMEDTARLLGAVTPGSTDLMKEGKELLVEGIRRTGPIWGQALSVLGNTDPLSGEALYRDADKGILRGSLDNASEWEMAPSYLKALVRYKPGDPRKGTIATVDPRVVWVLRGIPPSRFINVSSKIRSAQDPGALNYTQLARSLLGPSLYRFDPLRQQYYINEQKLQKARDLLRNVGLIGEHTEIHDFTKEDKDYRRPYQRRRSTE